jgi:2-oxoglutarate dehydrogenase E2 component (dihydrolipoamide succinyltransferase)
MAIIEVKVPQLSESVAEATLLAWKKKPGEAVEIDEILIEIAGRRCAGADRAR